MTPALREVIELAYTNWRWRQWERQERPLTPIVVEIEMARWSPTADYTKKSYTRVGTKGCQSSSRTAGIGEGYQK